MKITMQNYEEWMIDYIEGNLSAEQEKAMHEFLAFHPELRAELELFQHTRLEPETVVFTDKASLKREEPAGRVITMFSWVRYAAAAAAMVAVFIGFRYLNQPSGNEGIQRYAHESWNSISNDRKTDKTPVIEPVQQNDNNDYADANQHPHSNKIKSLPQEEVKSQIHREINPIQGIDFASVDQISAKEKNADLRDIMEVQEEEQTLALTDKQITGTNSAGSTVISLNDNNTVVDWWIDAVAIGGEVGSVVNGVREAEINPFKRKEIGGEEIIKTRNISVPGFSFYSRKKSNH